MPGRATTRWSLLALALLLPVGARAEPGRDAAAPWSLSIGTGGGGYVEFADAFSGSTFGYDTARRGRLQLNLRLEHALGPRYLLGLAWTYNHWTEDYLAGATRVGAVDNDVHALMVGVTSRWLRAEWIELYSGIAVGGARWSRQGRGAGAGVQPLESGLAFQLRGLGLSAGTERLRAFVELGLGFEGLLIGGLTFRF